MEQSEKKIAVAGIGGVGGYLAAMLAETYTGQVTFVARGERLQLLRENGLTVHSELSGDFCVHPKAVLTADELPEQDYIFLCVKNYSLEEVCEQLRGAVGEHTVVVPVMNGVDPADRVRKALGRGIVVDALIYIVAFVNGDGSVNQQGDFARLRIGRMCADEEQKQAIARLSELLTNAGLEHLAAEDIELEIWRKYILNCAYNVATAAYDYTIGQLRDDPKKAAEYEALITEAYTVAQAKGVAVLPEHKEEFFASFRQYRADATSSLQRDINAGRRTELDIFTGYLLREAEACGVEVPVTAKMHGLLQSRLKPQG